MRWATIWLLLLGTAAQADPVQSGLSFLLQQQGPNGAFGESSAEEPSVATFEALLSLRALGMATSNPAQNAELYLTMTSASIDSEIRLRRNLALASTAFALSPASLLTGGPGFEAADALHLAWTLKAGKPQPGIPLALGSPAAQLSRMALPGGCFGYADNDASVELTADAISALSTYSFDLVANSAHQSAIGCLRGLQRPDGSFGSSSATAAAALALLAAPGSNASAIAAARAYLIAAQRADGSWEGGARATALAVRALGQTSPDWRVTTDEGGTPLLVLADPAPVKGALFWAKLDIESRSGSPAPAITVRFMARPVNGGPEVVLADAPLAAMAPGQLSHVSALLDSSALGGRYTLRAVVNPDGVVPELDATNDEADAPLNVLMENDLAISAASIRFTPLGPGQVQVGVAVTNYGVPLPSSVPVDVYDGSPSGGGVKIGTAMLAASLGVNQAATVSVVWSSQAANGPTAIYAVVDPQNLLAEANRTNNTAFRLYYPGANNPVDLAVVGAEATLSVATAVVGRPFTFTIPVHNLSTFDANRVPVAVYDAMSKTLLGQVEVPLVPAQGAAPASFSISLAVTGSPAVNVVVDPGQLLDDSNRNNNTTSRAVPVASGAPAELAMTSVAANPSSGAPGAPALLTLGIVNSGTEAAQSWVRVGNLTLAGQLWARVPVTIAAGQGVSLKVAGVFPAMPAVLQACVEAVSAEVNANDNCMELGLGDTRTDLSLHPRDLLFDPVGADVGERVRMTATVRNNSATSATAVLQWFQGPPRDAESRLLGSTPIEVPANATASASLDWIRQEGIPEVHALIAQVQPPDSSLQNNAKGRHLFLETIVDVGLNNSDWTMTPVVRSGRITGNATPELAVGFEDRVGSNWVTGVRVLQRTASGEYGVLWEHQTGLQRIGDVALADLDDDGIPEVVVQSFVSINAGTNTHVRITALEPDGSIKWDNVATEGKFVISNPGYRGMGIGDVDGDGMAEVVSPDVNLRVLSGRDGSVILSVPMPGVTTGQTRANAVVLDVDGDGRNEVLATIGDVGGGTQLALVDGAANIRWRQGWGGPEFAVVDLDGDGFPEVVRPTHMNAPRAYDARTGALIQTGASYSGFAAPISIGALRQDGLPYPVLGNNAYNTLVAAFTPDLQILWQQELAPFGASNTPHIGSLADLRGLGRPQLVTNSSMRALTLQDGRDGRVLLPI
ncbi:MAG: CARDB domain-containing protein, partial [Myxococcaceae bacterium]